MNPEHWPAFAEARWFAGKGRGGRCVAWRGLGWWGPAPEVIQGRLGPGSPQVVVRSEVATIAYPDGDVEHYQIPVSYRRNPLPGASLDVQDAVLGYAHDAVRDPEALRQILAALGGSTTAPDGSWSTTCRKTWATTAATRVFGGEQSNTNVLVGTEALVKFYRRLEPGPNPDIEVLAALTPWPAASTRVSEVADLYAWASASIPPTQAPQGDAVAGFSADLAMVVEQFPEATNGWDLALESPDFTAPADALGHALAQVHSGLAASFGTQTVSGALVAAQMAARLDAAAHAVPELEPCVGALNAIFGRLAPRELVVQRIHGDFHLAQALMTPNGWRIIDFEGEPMKTVAERTAPDAPIRDVAGLIRSLDYAEHTRTGPGESRHWREDAVAAFLQGYRTATTTSGVLSGYEADVLAAYLADRAIYELVYESRNRPDLVAIPATAIARLTQGVHR